jgi:hypothetical protein
MTTATVAADTNPVAQSKLAGKGKLTKILSYIGYFIVLCVVLDWWGTNRGSNEWELDVDKDGIQVYSMKTPGASVKKFKAVTTFPYTLSHMLAAFKDDTIGDDCEAWVTGCVSLKFIKPWDSRLQQNVQLWELELFPPFDNRELLLQGTLVQDPATKVVTIENTAVPNKVAPNDCCVRLSHVHNVWTYTPLPGGKVKVEFVQDIDMGGFFPDFLLNLGGADETYRMFKEDMPRWLSIEKYKHEKLDFIQEL